MKNNMESKIPNPATKEAIKAGCICPVMDNEYGRGYMGQEGVFVYNANCPVHGGETKKAKGGFKNEK